MLKHVVALLCRTMAVSRNGFYRWLQVKHRPAISLKAERDAYALACWKASRGSPGSRTLSVVLRKEGFNLGRHATRSLMKKLGLSGVSADTSMYMLAI